MKTRILPLTLALLALSVPAAALDPQRSFHQYVKDTWSIEEGLPQITVQAIAQDGEGYVWLGTQAGLARFDGVRFVTFSPANTPALAGMFVQSLHYEAHGRLWIGTYMGLAVHENGEFRRVPALDGDGAERLLDVRDIAVDAVGTVRVASPAGLFRVAEGRLIADRLLGERETFAVLADSESLWVGGRGGTYRLAHGRVEVQSLPARLESAAVLRLVHTQGRLWAGTGQGLHVLDASGWQPFAEHSALIDLPIDTLYADSRGNLWAGTNRGLARIRDGQVVEFVDDTSPHAHRSVRAMLEDREGNLWAGSQWQGVARLWPGWIHRFGEPEGLHEAVLWSVAAGPDGSVWAGTNDGVSLFDGERFRMLVPGHALPQPHAYTLLPEDDSLWIGTRMGLARYRNGAVLRDADFAALDGKQINGILRDRGGRLWLATMDGLFRYQDARMERLGRAHGLVDPRVRVLFETRGGDLLAGSQAGLYRVEGERLVPLGLQSGLRQDMDVTALAQLEDGRLVLGTLSEELFVQDGARWQRFAASDGLPVNSPFFITEDTHGFLWVAGIRGVYRVPIGDLDAVAAGRMTAARGEMLLNERGDRRSGQKGHCCNGAGNAKGFARDGTLWLPTRSGLVAMPTDGIVHNEVVPTVVIESVRAGQQRHDARTLDLALEPSLRDLAFEFTALSLQDPRSVQIRYRLSGHDREWRELEDVTRRSAFYSNLPAGQYRFEVLASNNADRWSTTPATLEFRIEPWFHETIWFDLLIALAILAAVAALLARQMRRHRIQRECLEHLVQQRTLDLERANRKLADISQRDVVTGLHNRRFLIEQLPSDLAWFDRNPGNAQDSRRVMVFAIVDIDRFKSINDRYGHAAGDRILAAFARILEAAVRSSDYVVRWGGEEFLLVFRPMPIEETMRVAERIRASVAAHEFDIGLAQPLRITCSVGLAEYPFFADAAARPAWEQVVAMADQAMYRVKAADRNGWALLRATPITHVDSLADDLSTLVDAMLAVGELEMIRSRAGETSRPHGPSHKADPPNADRTSMAERLAS